MKVAIVDFVRLDTQDILTESIPEISRYNYLYASSAVQYSLTGTYFGKDFNNKAVGTVAATGNNYIRALTGTTHLTAQNYTVNVDSASKPTDGNGKEYVGIDISGNADFDTFAEIMAWLGAANSDGFRPLQ